MSFLDNLENTLNQMERGQDKEAERADLERRALELEAARAVEPWAAKLKQSEFVNTLLGECMRLGHAMRVRVGPVWLGQTLRLEAREKRLELQPTPEGIVAVQTVDGAETLREPVDLAGDGAALARRWLGHGG